MQALPEVIDIENPIFYPNVIIAHVIIAHVIIAHVIIAHVNVDETLLPSKQKVAGSNPASDASIFCVQWCTCSL
jgi:hypothetical protein